MSRGRGSAGFVLVAVLWMLVLMGIVGSALFSLARADRRLAMYRRDAAQARWAASAGLNRTLAELDRRLRFGSGLLATGEGGAVLPPEEARLGDVVVTIRTVDARSRIDAERADSAQLEALARALNLDIPDRLALSRAAGARAAGIATAELRDVPGLSADAYRRLAPHVTTNSDGRINVNTAPIPVLLTLPAIDREAAAAIAARRHAFPIRNIYELVSSLPQEARRQVEGDLRILSERVAFAPRGLDVDVLAGNPAGPTRVRLRAAIELTGGTTWRVRRVVEE